MTQIKGYLHLVFESIEAESISGKIHSQVSLNQNVKISTTPQVPGPVHQVFLFEIPKQSSRLSLILFEGENKIGDSRYDIAPFFDHAGISHVIEIDIFDNDNNKKAKIKLKITYYSAEHGKLKIRIFSLQFVKPIIEQFKQAKVKVRYGIHAQNTPIRSLSQPFDEEVQVKVLLPSHSLSFQVVHQSAGSIATYTIENPQQAKLLIDQSKAYQVSLFSNNKAIGNIKYQLTWIKPK